MRRISVSIRANEKSPERIILVNRLIPIGIRQRNGVVLVIIAVRRDRCRLSRGRLLQGAIEVVKTRLEYIAALVHVADLVAIAIVEELLDRCALIISGRYVSCGDPTIEAVIRIGDVDIVVPGIAERLHVSVGVVGVSRREVQAAKIIDMALQPIEAIALGFALMAVGIGDDCAVGGIISDISRNIIVAATAGPCAVNGFRYLLRFVHPVKIAVGDDQAAAEVCFLYEIAVIVGIINLVSERIDRRFGRVVRVITVCGAVTVGIGLEDDIANTVIGRLGLCMAAAIRACRNVKRSGDDLVQSVVGIFFDVAVEVCVGELVQRIVSRAFNDNVRGSSGRSAKQGD